jgi:mono/diheme cytochrome c family protein
MNHVWQARLLLLWLGLALPAHGAMTAEQARLLPPPASSKVDFTRDIKPIFEASCVKCHGRGRAKGGFQIDTRETLLRGGDSGPAAIAHKSQESLLIELVSGVDPDNVMPRKGSRLSAAQVGLLRAWIDQGLGWDPKITFARPEPLNLTPRSPRLGLSLSGGNPVDRFLRPYFRAHQFKPPAVVDDRVFARRVYLDTIGLLPPPADLDRFLAEPYRDKRARLVRRLLDENQPYAQHWLSFWNDLLRNDYRGAGFIDGGREQITPWLFSALRTNMAYDQFVAQLINPTHGSEGFTKGIVWRGVVNASQSPPMQAAQNISQVFMGVNLKCASCHDSFVNDWRLTDSYGLASVYSDKPLELFQCDKPTGQTAEARFIYPQLGQIDPNVDKAARLRRLAELITSRNDGRLSRTIVNRLWACFFGRGLVETVDDMEQSAWNQDLLDWLAEDLVAHHYDLKQTVERILTSRAYQLPAVKSEEAGQKNYVFRGPGVRRLSAEQFRDALGELTDVWCRKSELSAVTNQVRASLVAADPLALALGRPTREQVVTCRSSAPTTLQALELTNGHTLAKLLQDGAERLTTTNLTTDDLIKRLYLEALGRQPSGPEKLLASHLLGQHPQKEGVEDLLWAMVMLPEFQLIY